MACQNQGDRPKALKISIIPLLFTGRGGRAGKIPSVMTGTVDIRGHSGRDFVNVPFDDGRFQIIRRFMDPCTMSPCQ
jgi:hypothetical protein